MIRTALTRAYFCEELARPFGLSKSSSELSLMGMLSIHDALLDRPMAKVLSELSLSGEIRAALNAGGSSFDDLYATLLAYEKGDWARLSGITKKRVHSDDQVPDCYLAASKRAGCVVTLGRTASPAETPSAGASLPPAPYAIERNTCAFYSAFSPSIAAM